MLQKNLNADMTNPNVYNSIDENFEDHVYDEIKQKDFYPGKKKILKFKETNSIYF